MLGVQNNLPISNQVKFGSSYSDDNDDYNYDIPDQLPDSVEIEAERDEKMAKINNTKSEFDDLANTLEKNPSKLSQKAGKVVRVGSMIAGLAGTFVMAKYGAKVSMNGFKSFAKSDFVKTILKGGNEALKKAKPAAEAIKNPLSNVTNSLVKSLKDTPIGKKALKVLEKPMIKNSIEKVVGYKEAGKALLKTINGEKVQSAIENTMAASATASVLIDDLAGRNDNKSNLDVALGASGGDR